MIYREPTGQSKGKSMGERRSRQVVVALVLVLGISKFSLAAAPPEKLRVAYTAFAGTFTVLWVGKEAGLYQKHGADLDLLYIGSSTKAVQALLGGDIDIMYSAAGAVVDANLAGADLAMIGCQYDQGQTSFFTSSSITSIAALKGKAVGVTRFGAFSDFVARHVLKKNRLQPVKDVAFLQLGGLRRSWPTCKRTWFREARFRCPVRSKPKSLAFESFSRRRRLHCRLTTVA